MSNFSEDEARANEEEIGRSMVNTITNDGTLDLVTSLAELALDDTMQEGLWKNVPILGSLVNIARAGITIRDYFFVKKLRLFLLELKKIPEDQRAAFNEKLQDSEFRRQVGEHLILLLERLDDMAKPQLVGLAFAAYVRHDISYDDFIRMSTAINQATIIDLMALEGYYEYTDFVDFQPPPYVPALTACGLLRPIYRPSSESMNSLRESTLEYRMTTTGMLILYICLLRSPLPPELRRDE